MRLVASGLPIYSLIESPHLRQCLQFVILMEKASGRQVMMSAVGQKPSFYLRASDWRLTTIGGRSEICITNARGTLMNYHKPQSSYPQADASTKNVL